MRIGAAQLRALVAMSLSPHGRAPVPWASASGLVNRGLAQYAEPLRRHPHPTCAITRACRDLVAEVMRAAA